MHRISAPNKRFLKDYHDVLSHHIKCILKSGMMLDEDMNLLMTFWNRNLLQISPKSKRHLILTSVTFATAGLMTSMKLRNFFPLLISIIPTTLQLALRAATRYWRNRYKKNFEKLLSTIRLIHDLNREIGQYYNKRDAAAQNQKLQMDAFNILLKPGEDFLRGAIATLVGIIDEIRKNMLQVCKLVPISEGEFICSLVWNLDELQIYNDTSFNEMKLKFEKLSDLYLLITSNFLSCIGLSFCVQLWKEPCNLPKIFNDVVPHLGNSLCKSLNDIKTNFNLIRFNLHDRDIVKIGNETGNNVSVQLHRPLTDLLLNLQITFETTKHLQVLVEHEQNSYEEYIAILEDINKQVAASRASLSILINRFALLAKRVTVKNECAKELPLDVANKNTDVVEAINCSNNDEDGIYTLEDEEYNLSIHGSDVDDYIDYIEDPADQRSTEDLSVLLLELKRNLMQREGKLGKQAREESGAGDVEKSQPLPPPLPLELPERLPFIPDATDVRGLLRAVTLTAQRLNRAEEVFGSGTISSSDSDDS